MPLRVQCQHCDSRLSVREELAGKLVKCPKCCQGIRIPAVAAPGAADVPHPPVPKAKPKPRPAPEPVRPIDEFSSFDDDEQLQKFDDDEDEEFFDDPYSHSAAKLPPSKKSTSLAARSEPATASIQKSNTGPLKKFWWLGAAGVAIGLIGGLGVGAIVFSNSSDNANATASVPGDKIESSETPDADPAPIPGSLPAAQPELTADQLAEAADIRRVLEKMTELITAEKDREFLIQFGPIDELRKLQSAESANRPLPEVPRESLLKAIQAVSGEIADVGDSALLASVSVEVTGDTGDPQWAPGPGYDGDVAAVIVKSIAELEQGRIHEFMLNMFPPVALRVMSRNGTERSFAAKVDMDSALVVRMLQDLKLLTAEQPQITGDVAEFSLPAVEYAGNDVTQIRPALAKYPVPDRIIRFSKINGHWRFYDDGSLRQTGALDGSVIQLKLERVGTSWRLLSYPRI